MLCSLIPLAAWLITASAGKIELVTVPEPDLDLSSFNSREIGLLGDFDAITRYSYQGSLNFTNQNNLTNNLYYTEGDNSHFISLGEVDGFVSKILPVTTDTFLLLGNFTSIGGQNLSAPATFNITSNDFTTLDSDRKIDGTVTIGFYDSSDNLIYLGGDFSFNSTNGAAFYNLTSQSLQSTPFEGFGDNSKINSILKAGDNIIFGGHFDTLGLPELLSSTYDVSNISVQSDQLVSLKYATFTAYDDSSMPDVLACPASGEEWAVSGTTSATLDIGLPYSVIPSKIRIYNSNNDDDQIQLFRMITQPAGSIMNLTYVDPETGELAYCDAWCPLLDSTSLAEDLDTHNATQTVAFYDTSLSWSTNYQEFGFVNQVDVWAVSFQALDSYGNGIALAGFEIYQSLFSTYANNTLNEPACNTDSNYSTAGLTGNWQSSPGNEYLMTTADVSEGIPDVGVTFYPNITYAGEYSILLYTPGCAADNTCDFRGIVNVSIFDDITNDLIETSLIYQTNNEEKYDSLYYGHLDNSVRVEMFMYSTALSGDQTDITMVADRITTTILSIDRIIDANGTVPINGIFEYSPSNFTKFNAENLSESSLIGNTTINLLGSSLSDNATVQLAFFENKIYVGGEFESEHGDNFFVISVDSGRSTSLITSANVSSVNGGLNGAVTDLEIVADGVIILGDFNDTNNSTEINSLSQETAQLDGAALYNGSWFSFGNLSSSRFSNLTLENTEYWAFESEIWNAGYSTWFDDSVLLSFNVSSAGKTGDSTLFVGSLKTSDRSANKGIMLSNTALSGNVTSDSLTNSSIYTGWFINDTLSAFGGDFTTASGLENLILVSGNHTSGLNISWDDGAFVTQLFAHNGALFIGSNGGGSADGDDFNGVLFHNFSDGTLVVPGLLSGDNVTVTQFGYFNHTYLVVGGEFTSADSKDCSGLCFYNMNETFWAQLIEGFSGKVNSFRFVEDTIVAGGDFKYDDVFLKLFAYNFNATSHGQPDHFSDVKFEVKKFLLVDNSTSGRIIAAGETEITAYDGSSWTSITGDLDGSTIEDIELLEIVSSNSNNNGSFFDDSQILLASGNLTISGYGYANVAYFNGSSWVPYAIGTHQRTTATVSSIFMNKDMSSLQISGTISNTTSPSTSTSSAPSSSSSSSTSKKKGKMHAGFVVLIGLALGFGTVSLLGTLAAFIYFRNNKHTYVPIEPRVNETEMLDTVPPENLFKHVA